MELLAALDRGNLFTVGDEFQSIYGFRHADVGIFRERHAAARAARRRAGVLSANFRSRAAAARCGQRRVRAALRRALRPARRGPRGEGDDAGEPVLELLLTDTDGWEAHEERLGVELAPAPLWRRAEARAARTAHR